MSVAKITTQILADSTAERWAAWYKGYSGPTADRKKEIAARLSALDNPTPEQVNEIIGNTSWTSINCEACGRSVEAAAVIQGNNDDLIVCKGCLEKAIKVLS